MKKHLALKKQIINLSTKAGVAIAIFGGAAYYADYYLGQNAQILQQADAEIAQKRIEIAKIEDDLEIYETSFNNYADLDEKIRSGNYELDIKRSGKILELLSRKHRITNLNVDIGSKEKIGTVEYVAYNPTMRKVKLTFSAMSDAHIYEFLSNVEKYFSGNLRFSEINMLKKRELDYDIMSEISKGGSPALLEANVNFLWLGIELKNENTTTPTPNNNL